MTEKQDACTVYFIQNPQVQTRKEEAGLGQTAKCLASFLWLFQSMVLIANALLQKISRGAADILNLLVTSVSNLVTLRFEHIDSGGI